MRLLATVTALAAFGPPGCGGLTPKPSATPAASETACLEEPESEPEPAEVEAAEPGPDPDLEVLNEAEVSARVEEIAGEDGHGVLLVQVDDSEVLEEEVSFGSCIYSGIEADIEVIDDGQGILVFDARVRCVWGGVVLHEDVQHLVLAASDDSGADLSVLYRGKSSVNTRAGLRLNKDSLEFYREAEDLAVYRHTVSWCDEAGMEVELGESHTCGRTSPRTLTLLKRIPIP